MVGLKGIEPNYNKRNDEVTLYFHILSFRFVLIILTVKFLSRKVSEYIINTERVLQTTNVVFLTLIGYYLPGNTDSTVPRLI